jgi:ParB-like chromosome segregation protein Spo0J
MSKKNGSTQSPSSTTAPVVTRQVMFGPSTSILVAGIHSPQDETNPLYDSRAIHLPLNLELVAKIVKAKSTKGIFPPVEVSQDTEGKLWTLDGRERMRAVYAASAQLGMPLDVEYTVYDGPSGSEDLYLLAKTRNGGRVDDSPYQVAKGAERAKTQYGTTLAKFAAASGMALQDLKMKMRLLRLVPELVSKLEAGELPATVGFQLAMLDPAKQVEGYNQLVDQGQLTVMGAKRLKVELQGGTPEAAPGGEGEGEASEGEGEASEGEGEATVAPTNNAPKGWLGLTLSEVRKLWNTTKAQVCPLSDESIAVIETILGERPLAQAPIDLQAAVRMLRDGTLPRPNPDPKPAKEPKAPKAPKEGQEAAPKAPKEKKAKKAKEAAPADQGEAPAAS